MYSVKVLERFQRKPSKAANILVYHKKNCVVCGSHVHPYKCLFYTPLVCLDRLGRMSSYNMMFMMFL